jgi:hypothetical protein
MRPWQMWMDLARRSALWVTLVVLTGCATNQVARDPVREPPKSGEAMTVVSITINTPQVTAIDGIRLERIKPASDIKSFFHLRVVAPGLARDTSLFVGVLPEGEYQVVQLDHFASQRYLPLGAPQSARLGVFSVASGRPVDLGRLVVTPVNTSVVVGRSSLASDNQELLRRFAPEHAQLFGDRAPAQGWLQAKSDKDWVESYAFERPTGAVPGPMAADGRLVAASRLGTVLVRGSSGQWSTLRSGRLESLMYATPVDLPDIALVALGEFTTFLKQRRGGTRLEPLDPGNLPKGNLIFLAGSAKAGWYLAAQVGDKVRLLHAKTLEGGDWQTVREEDVGFSFWSGANPVWFWPTAGGMAYATAAGQLHVLNFATGQWEQRSSPGGSRLISLTPNPDGSLGALTSPGGGFGGVFAKMHLSRDEGRSWKPIPSGDVSVKIMPPAALADGSLLMAGGVFSDPSIYTSNDDGATWTRRGKTRLDRTLYPLPSGPILAVDHGQFGVFSIASSNDRGATWTVEYSNFDRRAYEAREKPKAEPAAAK